MAKFEPYPTECQLCGGSVYYTLNKFIYGRSYGSGYIYVCDECGATVGTHRNNPRRALGILASPNMRKGKQLCHKLFDKHWNTGPDKGRRKRSAMYKWLSIKMGIDIEDCHFGHMGLEELRKAYRILKKVEHRVAVLDNDEIIFIDKKHMRW